MTLLVVLVLALPAVVPLIALIGLRPEMVALALPAGCLLAGGGASAAVMTHSAFIPWLVALALIVNAAAVALLTRARRQGSSRPVVERGKDAWLPALVATGVAIYGLTQLRRHEIGWDTRSIWFVHARL